jgi:sporulation protein YpjB
VTDGKRINQRILWIIIVVIILSASIQIAQPERAIAETAEPIKAGTTQNQKLQELEQAAEALYQSMQSGQAEEAQLQIERVTLLVGNLSYDGLTGVEGIHELTACVMDVRAAVLKAAPSPEVWKMSSAKLRLAVDSLVHAKGAMWLQYHKVLQDDVDKLYQAAIDNNRTGIQQAFAELKDHYEMIRPAALIHKNVSGITALDSWMSYIGSLTTGKLLDLQTLKTALAGGRGLLQSLFGKPKEEPVLLPITGYSNPWHWSFLIGIWIFLALGYTAYRKFVGGQAIRPASPGAKPPPDKRTW